jgi:hypothetical protein
MIIHDTDPIFVASVLVSMTLAVKWALIEWFRR